MRNPTAKSVRYEKDFLLYVVFVNGEEKTFDLTPYLVYPVYEKLQDEAYCAKAKIQKGIVGWDE